MRRRVVLFVPNYTTLGTIPHVEVVEAIEEELEKHAIDLVVVSLKPFMKKKFLQAVEKTLEIYSPIAIMFLDVYPSSSYFEFLKELQIPVLFVAQELEEPGLGVIVADNFLGGALVAKHFLEIRAERPVVIGPVDTPEGKKRLEGFNASWKASSNREPAVFKTRDWTLFDEELKRFMERFNYDSVFALSDKIGLSVMFKLKEKQVKIPQEVAICGYDNDFYASMPGIDLSSVKQETRAVGTIASEVVRGKIPVARYVFGVELVVRGSSRR